jgi:HEAT repeat protein
MLTLPKPFLVLLASVLIPMQQEPPKSPAPSPSSPKTAPQTATPPSSRGSTQVPGSPSTTPQGLKKEAWEVLQSGFDTNKTADRAAAIHVLGLLKNDGRARKMAEEALLDHAPEVRAAAAAALGDMHARASLPKLRAAIDDKDPSVTLAAAHALILLNDDSGYEVYYEVLTGERKTGKGVLTQAAAFKDPKKLAELGFQQGIGFIPFAGLGWKAFKAIKKDDSSPVRAAAATVLTRDPDPKTTQVLADAAGDKNWIIRAAALEALARRGDRSVLNTVELYLSDQEGEVKYTAAATALRLIAVKTSRPDSGKRSESK